MDVDLSCIELSKRVRDDEFYMQNVIFLVEDRLFNVPKMAFVLDSEVFKAMFELPQDPAATIDGMADESPIRLAGVKKEDFKNLLRVMYSRAFMEEEKLSEEQWTSVLVLAARWDMERLRNLAINRLTPSFATNAHKMVVMGRKYEVESWLISGIRMLVIGKEPMGEQDADIIGTIAVMKVSAIREWTLRWRLAHRDSTEWILNRQEMPPNSDILERIRDAFGIYESG